jgi:hypothetical protein
MLRRPHNFAAHDARDLLALPNHSRTTSARALARSPFSPSLASRARFPTTPSLQTPTSVDLSRPCHGLGGLPAARAAGSAPGASAPAPKSRPAHARGHAFIRIARPETQSRARWRAPNRRTGPRLASSESRSEPRQAPHEVMPRPATRAQTHDALGRTPGSRLARTKRCRDPRPGLERTTCLAARQDLVSRARSKDATLDPGPNARRARQQQRHAGRSRRAGACRTRVPGRRTRPAATDSDPAGPQSCGAAPRSQNETWPNGPTHTRRCDKQPPAAGHSASVTGSAPRRQPGGLVINSRARPRLTPGPTARPLTVLSAIGAPSGGGVDMGRGVSMRGPGRRPDVRRAPTDRTSEYRARPRGLSAARLWRKVSRATNPAGHRGRCGPFSLPGHCPRDFTGY